MNDQYHYVCRLGRRPGKQGPRPLSGDQGRVEKLVTGNTTTTTTTTTTAEIPNKTKILTTALTVAPLTATLLTATPSTTTSLTATPSTVTPSAAISSTAIPSTATSLTATTEYKRTEALTKTTEDRAQRLKMAKNIFTVGTWNVRTL
ncbi:unnamed protein product [Rotaria sp. Silwood2]|nr:unnamed protein product [Rotaria sp. Silwood2]CAF3048964.1 unnamed protein product [Rotaria sp. Silwood2]CAF3110487.1 unnamed protein product [Rotaria sp. Silwood2]CAF3953507.1 unnamed protein product [Rotaria sp. Silwood2]CAF4099446.1 unnamed protein product [Rotaria sp. Silwood2]